MIIKIFGALIGSSEEGIILAACPLRNERCRAFRDRRVHNKMPYAQHVDATYSPPDSTILEAQSRSWASVNRY